MTLKKRIEKALTHNTAFAKGIGEIKKYHSMTFKSLLLLYHKIQGKSIDTYEIGQNSSHKPHLERLNKEFQAKCIPTKKLYLKSLMDVDADFFYAIYPHIKLTINFRNFFAQ